MTYEMLGPLGMAMNYHFVSQVSMALWMACLSALFIYWCALFVYWCNLFWILMDIKMRQRQEKKLKAIAAGMIAGKDLTAIKEKELKAILAELAEKQSIPLTALEELQELSNGRRFRRFIRLFNRLSNLRVSVLLRNINLLTRINNWLTRINNWLKRSIE